MDRCLIVVGSCLCRLLFVGLHVPAHPRPVRIFLSFPLFSSFFPFILTGSLSAGRKHALSSFFSFILTGSLSAGRKSHILGSLLSSLASLSLLAALASISYLIIVFFWPESLISMILSSARSHFYHPFRLAPILYRPHICDLCKRRAWLSKMTQPGRIFSPGSHYVPAAYVTII